MPRLPNAPAQSDSVLDLMRAYTKPAAALVGVALVAGFGTWYYREQQALKSSRAEQAYYQAQASLASGNKPLAQADLQKVVDRFEGTPAAIQATLLLAQLRYDEGKHAEGVQLLEGMVGDAPTHLKSGVHALLAAGYEGQQKPAEAAAAYRQAAEATPYDLDRDKFLADAARAFTAAGRTEDARKIWAELADDPISPTAAEARVRLGELEAKPAARS